ncbi:ATP-binding protein [Candidatus Woesearchaeota archaeon]|nr:ATP-binding protein [Candidatus Woesearchaeota archaeon]
MDIYLPNSAFLGNIDPFLRQMNLSEPTKLKITANKKWISVHPAVLCIIAALGLNMKPVDIGCERLEAKSKHYLKRMGLFRLLNIESDISVTEHEPAGRFIPLTKIINSEELTRFITDIIPLLHLGPEQADSIKYVVSELVRNVLEHSGSKQGAVVSAQYYRKSNTIRIGIADTGVGIKKTINNAYPAETHLEAIRLALMPGVTGTTQRIGGTDYNAGAGLFFIKSIAQVNREFFMIFSGDAMYKLLRNKPDMRRFTLHGDPFKDRHSKREDCPHWQGTVVGVDISLNSTKEFSILLDLIRDAYMKTIKERKKEEYRAPRFI